MLFFFLISPLFEEIINFAQYFSDGLKPPTRQVRRCHSKKTQFSRLDMTSETTCGQVLGSFINSFKIVGELSSKSLGRKIIKKNSLPDDSK